MNKLMSDYYSTDDHVYTCPGKREYVTAYDEDGRKIHVKKKTASLDSIRLILKIQE